MLFPGLLCACALAQEPALLRGPYLQMANSTAVTVCWRTDVPGPARVRCGTAEENLTLEFADDDVTTEHYVRLTGLTPATQYFYAVETGDVELAAGPAFHFRTPPPAGADVPVRFWALGDAGTQSLAQQQVRDAFAPLHAQRRADLWLMLGDNAYGTGTDEEYQGAVFNMYPDYLRTVPLWSCLGNHETYSGTGPDGRFAYERIFVFPTSGECGGVASGTERYYSWNYGPIHFICLDSMTASRLPGEPMADWLEADLQANTLPWVVAFWHHPPYSKGSHNSDWERQLIDMREFILPILEDYGVDLVLCGHSHNYERSYLLDGHYGYSHTLEPAHKKNPGSGREDAGGAYYKAGAGMTPHQGAVYVTAGSSGQISFGSLDHPAHFIALNRLGSVVVDVNGTRMDVKFLREAAAPGAAPVFDDYFTIIKGTPPPDLPLLTRGPYLQMAAPAAMTVRWRTDRPGVGRVRFGTGVGALTGTVAESAATTEHEVRLTGLLPATKYHYRVDTDGIPLATGSKYFFTTPPPTGTTGPVRIWVLGDAGTQNLSQRQVRDAFIPLHAEQPADLWLMLGDNAYGSGRDPEYQAAVFDMYRPWLEQVPLWSCIGNHETYDAADEEGIVSWDRIFSFPTGGECGGVPSGTERYYSWNHANIHFVVLDSISADRAPGAPMAQWLRRDLEANTQQWTIALWHHPPYTKGSHDSDFEIELVEMREHLVPILEAYGVDLVLCGHSHCYERSWLLDGHYGTSDLLQEAHILNGRDGREDGEGIYVKPAGGPSPHEGTVYVVAGSSGQTSGGELNHPAHFLSLNELGSLVLDVRRNRLDARFLREAAPDAEGPVFDDWFTILKGGPAAVVPATGLAVLHADSTTAILHWLDNSEAEERYEVFLSVNGAPFILAATLPPDSRGFVLENLVTGDTYTIRVVASNIAGSAPSEPFSHLHDAGRPVAGPLQRWRFLHWGTTNGEGDRDLHADPEGDGSVNLLEYALGSSPRQAASVPQLAAGRTADGRLTLTFFRQPAPDVIYSVEFAPVPAPDAWQAAWTSSGAENLAGPVTVTDTAEGGAQRFARLRVTLAAP